MEIDDYKDYLIWKLCKKVKFLMKKKNEENTPSDNRVEKESSMNKIFNKDVINIHQRIEKSLSNIEFQLEFNEEGRDVKNENKENFQEDLKNKNNLNLKCSYYQIIDSKTKQPNSNFSQSKPTGSMH